jgi:hypothetical protein
MQPFGASNQQKLPLLLPHIQIASVAVKCKNNPPLWMVFDNLKEKKIKR